MGGGWLLGSGFVFGVCGNLTSVNYLSTGEWMGGSGTGWEGMRWEGGWLLGSAFVSEGCGNLTTENYVSTGEWMGGGGAGWDRMEGGGWNRMKRHLCRHHNHCHLAALLWPLRTSYSTFHAR